MPAARSISAFRSSTAPSLSAFPNPRFPPHRKDRYRTARPKRPSQPDQVSVRDTRASVISSSGGKLNTAVLGPMGACRSRSIGWLCHLAAAACHRRCRRCEIRSPRKPKDFCRPWKPASISQRGRGLRDASPAAVDEFVCNRITESWRSERCCRTGEGGPKMMRPGPYQGFVWTVRASDHGSLSQTRRRSRRLRGPPAGLGTAAAQNIGSRLW
jgi:hypothetical protein